MKVVACVALACGLMLAVQPAASANADPMGKIVTLLKDMQAKSKADAELENKGFADFKAYYETTSAEKKKSILDLGISIETLGNRIEELTAKKATLELEIAELTKDLGSNANSQAEANAARNNEKTAFEAVQKDLTDRIARLDDAVKTLSAVGGDQTQIKAMLLSIDQASSKMAESALASLQDLRSGNFLQVPTEQKSQSGAVTGVLKSVLDSSKTDLKTAQETEAKAIADHEKLMGTLQTDEATMNAAVSSKSAELSSTVSELSDKKGTLEVNTQSKATDEGLLANLEVEWKEKSHINEERLALRQGEEKAIQTALVILDGDRAGKVFKKVKSTAAALLDEDDDEADSFVQLSAEVHRHNPMAGEQLALLHLLRQAAHETHSSRLAEVAALVSTAAPNPFKEVLAEIENMKGRITEEEDVDEKQFKWCGTERAANEADKTAKEDQTTSLQGGIESVTNSIQNPESGLKASILKNEGLIQENAKEQAAQTKTRKGEHGEYLENLANLVSAEDMMKSALRTLKEFYAHMAEVNSNFIQLGSKAKDAPATAADNSYGGQSDQGNTVIGMLETVLGETTAEEMLAHKTEGDGQAAFEDSMKLLTDQEAAVAKTIADSKVLLAQAETDLKNKIAELESTETEHKAIVNYLSQIKPTCDFITINLDKRKASRVTETEALNKAKDLIQNSPAYKNHEAKATSGAKLGF